MRLETLARLLTEMLDEGVDPDTPVLARTLPSTPIPPDTILASKPVDIRHSPGHEASPTGAVLLDDEAASGEEGVDVEIILAYQQHIADKLGVAWEEIDSDADGFVAEARRWARGEAPHA